MFSSSGWTQQHIVRTGRELTHSSYRSSYCKVQIVKLRLSWANMLSQSCALNWESPLHINKSLETIAISPGETKHNCFQNYISSWELLVHVSDLIAAVWQIMFELGSSVRIRLEPMKQPTSSDSSFFLYMSRSFSFWYSCLFCCKEQYFILSLQNIGLNFPLSFWCQQLRSFKQKSWSQNTIDLAQTVLTVVEHRECFNDQL